MDAHEAAAYLGMHRDTVRKLATQRSIPVHQDGPRCKLYIRRDELDAWRCSTPSCRMSASLRAV
jgi:excisionase family DNA binding protein